MPENNFTVPPQAPNPGSQQPHYYSQQQQNNQPAANCPRCNAPVYPESKKCPNCGFRLKKRKWPYIVGGVLGVCVLVSMLGGGGKGSDNDAKPPENETAQMAPEGQDQAQEQPQELVEEVIPVTARQLVTDIETNAMKAQNDYNEKTLEISGALLEGCLLYTSDAADEL